MAESELISAIGLKYSGSNDEADVNGRWELCGFDKIKQKQSNIYSLKCIVLSRTNVSFLDVSKITPNSLFLVCTELDLSWTQVRNWSRIVEIIHAFPALEILRLEYY